MWLEKVMELLVETDMSDGWMENQEHGEVGLLSLQPLRSAGHG